MWCLLQVDCVPWDLFLSASDLWTSLLSKCYLTLTSMSWQQTILRNALRLAIYRTQQGQIYRGCKGPRSAYAAPKSVFVSINGAVTHAMSTNTPHTNMGVAIVLCCFKAGRSLSLLAQRMQCLWFQQVGIFQSQSHFKRIKKEIKNHNELHNIIHMQYTIPVFPLISMNHSESLYTVSDTSHLPALQPELVCLPGCNMNRLRTHCVMAMTQPLSYVLEPPVWHLSLGHPWGHTQVFNTVNPDKQ